MFPLCVAAALLCAQEYASLTGRVTDASGSVIPGATVRLTGGGEDRPVTAVSDARGRYEIGRLAPGEYSVRVASPGFAPLLRESVALATGEARIDFTLDIGPVVQEITVTARTPPLESAMETSVRNHQDVLEIREVRESSAKDVGEALSRLDGLWKVRKGGIANDVVLRGFQQDNLSVLIDGARIHGACPGGMDPAASHVDFAEVQHVEVTRGAFDMTTQGSLGGTVRIAAKNPEPGLRISPALTAGSFGFWNPSLVASLTGERAFGLAGYSFRRARPHVDGSGRAFTEYANYRPGYRDGEAFRAATAWFRGGGAPAPRQRLEFGYTRQQAGRTFYPYLLMDAVYDNADRANASWSAHDVAGPLQRLRVQSYFSRVRHWMTDEWRASSEGAPREFGMATFAQTRTYGARADADLPGLSIGVETYRRNWLAVNTLRLAGAYTDQASMPGVWTTVAGAYAQFHKTLLERLHLNAGARLDAAVSEAGRPGLNTDLYLAYHGTSLRRRSDANPSGAAWLSYALPGGVELFAGIGQTVRLPNPQERFYALRRMGSDWVGNPGLRPTRNTEVDAGFSLRRNRLTIRSTLFHSLLADYVTLLNQPRLNDAPLVTNRAARSYGNVDAAISGGEASGSYALTPALLLTGGVSLARGRKRGPVPPGAGYLAEMPPMKARAALRYGSRLFFAEAEGLAARAQNRVDTALLETRTPGYAVVNVKLGIHASKLKMALGLDNALDRFYREHYSFQRDPFRSGARVPEPGRSAFASLSYAF